MAQYGRQQYWDERYTKDPEAFDWYQRYSGLKDKLRGAGVKEGDNILNIGCGNSRMTEDMYEEGFTSITNIDISKVVIDQMKERHKDKSTLTWQVMNACHLDFMDETYDCIIDKGTVDSILCGEGSTGNISKMLSECARVLKPNGIFFMVSYGVPENRLGYLENDEYPWRVTVSTVPKPTVMTAAQPEAKDSANVHYIYIAQKEGSEEKE
mmetsp:Transcript_316/g.742  ORF Transcript_316/g.742 Transcript_316/m.742 type:complete len:210 (-) Transcript_316:348-977(-)|eukprot:CAMPEP_0171517232 /NCGR_PEP_ID=MMETSP0959-20130129/4539_1 /TAXON_ID=87120 /ORGANISM="Aurantiochytrium limacinum, Strain ATCCMYA-1381" /LENGTH=209 /DNA_ID=CAMNT_0012056153 /DNA_START=281 /DNA_END=910 /DNA_ORIENTATION=-